MNSPVPACTTFMKRCTMLVYRRFCICSVHTRTYTLRMPVAGGQLSCGILPFSCTDSDITVHGLSMYRRWHTRLYAFWSKCHRKADHLPQAFLGCIYAYVHCIYRTADSCTLAWYSASWRWYRRVRTACLKEIKPGIDVFYHHCSGTASQATPRGRHWIRAEVGFELAI